MNKFAQRRSLLNKIKEKANVGGIAAEKFFNPEFERVMDKLREFDSNLRSIAVGESVDGGDPGKDPGSLKDLLKEAESNFNRREYITSVAYLGRFHKKMSELVDKVNLLDMDVTKVHKDFLFKDLDEDNKSILREMNKRFANKVNKNSFVVNAGIMDFLHNIGTTRGRALAAWEKRYPKQVKKLKKDTQNLINKSKTLLNTLLSDFEKLASYRAARQVDDYMKVAFKFKSLFNSYHDIFNSYYQENVKAFLNNDDYLNPPQPVVEQVEVKNENASESVSDNVTNKIPYQDKTLMSHEELIKNEPQWMDGRHLNNKNTNTNTNTFQPQWIDVTYDKNGKKVDVDSPNASNNFINDVEIEKSITESELLRQIAPSQLSGLNDPIDPVTNKDVDVHADTSPPDTVKSAHYNFYKTLNVLSNESPILLANHIYKYAKSIKNTDPVVSKQLFEMYNEIMEK